IVEKVCKDAGLSNLKRAVAAAPPALDFVVQYRESDLDFVSRLLEDAGLYYTFTHVDGDHTVVFSDARAGDVPATRPATSQVVWQFSDRRPPIAVVFNAARDFAIHTGAVSIADHDLLRADSTGSAATTASVSKGKRFDFLGDLGPNASPAEAKRLMEMHESRL